MERCNEPKGGQTTVFAIRAYLAQKFNLAFSHQLVVEYALHRRLGYEYGPPANVASKRTPERIKQIRYFLLQYDEALKQQATAVIMYMDES